MIRTRAPGTRAPPPPPLLPSLSLLLLLLSPTVSGDCGPPPDIPNATPNSGRHTKFAHQSQVTYSCNKGFKQIPDKPNTVVCLENDQWSNYETFCNKTCSAPLRLNYASLKKEYRNMNFFPIGTTVEFECRPGFQKVTSRTGKSTCLEELVWSPVVEFCKKRACPNPRELKNGHINIPTDILFGSEIIFSCDKGYKLVGVTSTFCSITGNTVDWDDVFPVCTTIFCPDPPKINNGRIREERDSYAYRQSVTYSCDQGFILDGNSSIYCTLDGEVGEWSSAPPKCIERNKVPTKTPPEVDIPSTMPHESTLINFPSTRAPLSHKPTTVKVPGTRVKPTSHKPTEVNVPGTRVPPTSQKHTTVNVPSTRVPATSQKPSMVHVSDTRVSPKPQKPTKANSPSTEIPPTPQKANTADVPSIEIPPTPQKANTAVVPSTEIPPAPQKANTADVPSTEIPPAPQKANTADVPSTEIPPAPQKANTADVLATETPPAPQKANTAVVPATEIPPAPQKANTAVVPATETPPTPQKANTAIVPSTEIPPAPQKAITAVVPATETLLTPQKANTAIVPATEIPPAPQKTNTAVAPATEIPPTPQKANTADVPSTEIPPTPQKANTADVPSTEIPPAPQKTNTAVAPATEIPPTPQKANTADVPATEIPPTPQKANTADVPSTEIPPTPQKTNTAKVSAIKPATAQMSLISTTVFAQTPPITQHPTTVNSSAVQTVQTTRGFATAKPSLTQNPPATQRPTISHFSMTKGRHTVTQIFTSAHITATQHVPVTKTTVRHPTRTSKDRGESNSGGDHFIYGKFDPQGVKRNCHHCGRHSPYFWKRIFSYNCLRKTIKMQCLWVPKGRWVKPFNRLVSWTPLGIQHGPSYPQQCSCSKAVLGQLRVIWPISQVALSARCVSVSF